MKTKSKILILTTTFPRWRGDTDPPFVFDLCRRLVRDFDITVLAPHFPGSRTEEEMDGIRVVRFRYCFAPLERLAYGSGGGILARIRRNPAWGPLVLFLLGGQVLSTIRFLRQEKFALIHAHWLIPQALSAIVARAIAGSQIPIIATAHGGDLYGLRGRIMDWLRGLVFAKSAAVTVVSNAMARDVGMTGVPAEKIHVIPMGTDLTDRFCPGYVERNSKQVLFVGRLVEKKGCRYLIEAWPEVVQAEPEARLLIVGDGPEREGLGKLVQELNVGASISFLGGLPQASLPDLYRKSAVVVFPSIVGRGGDQEGFGLVLVEAMGCECAVVVSDLPAMRDIVQDGETGLVVGQKAVSDFAIAINRLLTNPSFAWSLGQRSRGYVADRFAWSVISNCYRVLINVTIRFSGRQDY